jgi:hypothetical protein
MINFKEYLGMAAGILVVVYFVPIVLLYKAKHLLILLLILIFTPICTILSMFAAGELFPLKEDDLGAGILWIFLIGYNYTFIFLGTCLGVVLKIILEQKRKFNKEIPES